MSLAFLRRRYAEPIFANMGEFSVVVVIFYISLVSYGYLFSILSQKTGILS
jgi:hypothetical protein